MQRILEFKHICFRYKGNKDHLFDQLDFTVRTGELVAILGASGSGKTTLTEILLQRLKPTCRQFQILENGQPIKPRKGQWAYVPQKNLLRENLTVDETFSFYANIHLNGEDNYTKEQKIQHVISDLGLTEFKPKKISELSGGQQRRVSIGVELLSRSPYFILDEPSSGLDALSDANLLRTLKILAQQQNKAIIVITHNTENLAIFNKIIFLSKGKPTFVGDFRGLLRDHVTSNEYNIDNYLNISLAQLYKTLDNSQRIHRI